MKAAFFITLIMVINYARTVHTKDKTNKERKESHSSGVEGSQSLEITSRAKLTNENESEPVLPESYEMLDGNDLNEDESFVLIPLKTLVKNPRIPRDTKSENEKDPLYVIIPYKELSHPSDDLGKPVQMIAEEDRIAVKRSVEDATTRSDFENVGHRRKGRSISRIGRLSRRKGVKRSFKYPYFNNRNGDIIAQLADSDTLWEVPLSKFLRNNRGNPYPLAQIPQATYKSKKSLGSYQPLQELFAATSQMPKTIISEIRDLNFTKSKDNPSIISKLRRASCAPNAPNSPVNITLYISNLIPPNEVENTKITNSGKLFNSGCLKFSIQLEKPNGSPPDNCCAGECCNKFCKTTSSTLLLPLPTKASCCHLERITEDNKNLPWLQATPTRENPVAHPRGQNVNIENAQTPAVGLGKGQIAHSCKSSTEISTKLETNLTPSRDATALLLQLIGLDKKPVGRKTVPSSPAQAVLMDSDIVKELQRLLANQGSTTAPIVESCRAYSQVGPARIVQQPKAKVIADALNLFSKFASVRQPNLQNK